jgi:putative aminopeptidase FrvX
MLTHIKELCALPGISGREDRVREAILAYLTAHARDFTYHIDPLGSLIVKKGQSPEKIALYAHMDEVGMMITHITAEGLLGFSPMGMDARVLFGRRVRVGEDLLPGVIGGKAWHHMDSKEREAPLKTEQMAIDIGARDKDEALKYVRPGDMAVPDAPFVELGGGRIAARALDNRVGCALLCRLIAESEHGFTAVFTVQEETGLNGAAAAANALGIPTALILETTTAGDLPDVEPHKQVCRLGAGPVLSFADKGAIYSRPLLETALTVAADRGIATQLKEGVFGGNDSRAVQRAGPGARVLAVSVPCRYLHSASCVADTADIEATYRLLYALLPALV